MAAYHQVYTTPLPALTARLQSFLGRPLIAHMLEIADLGIVSRWAGGTLVPEVALGARLRTIATVFAALEAIAGEAERVADWFTGANPNFGHGMAAGELRAGRDAAVYAAVRALAES